MANPTSGSAAADGSAQIRGQVLPFAIGDDAAMDIWVVFKIARALTKQSNQQSHPIPWLLSILDVLIESGWTQCIELAG